MPLTVHTFKANTVGVGFSKALGNPAGKVSITNNTTANIYVKVGSGDAPATPTNAYIPGNDAWAATYGIIPGQTLTFGEDSDGAGYKRNVQEPIDWVAGWCVAAGEVAVAGH